MDSKDTVRKYYDENVLYEWERMDRHPLELGITSHYLRRYIKPGARVLDVGGGPGRYSLMLAEMGCDVTLVDLSPANVAFALQKAEERGLQLKAYAGDACELEQVVSGPFDVVLNMGPLYHLQSEEARRQAVSACRNVLTDNGLVFATIISAHAGMLYYLENDLSLITAEGEKEYLIQLAQDLPYTGKGFTDCHFMRVWDFCPLMESCGFNTLHRVACEGVCSTHENEYMLLPEEIKFKWLDLSLKLCERDEFLGFAQHVLYIGRKC